MCTGEIVVPVGRSRSGAKKSDLSISNFFKKIFEKITYSNGKSVENIDRVNMCLMCGDLEIYGCWQKIPHPQRTSVSEAIKSEQIVINGYLRVCDFCASMKKETKEKKENLYKDTISICADGLVSDVSSLSF